jgi:cytochrome P450
MHDENLFPDSKVFNPERFIGSDGRCSGHEKVLAFKTVETNILFNFFSHFVLDIHVIN